MPYKYGRTWKDVCQSMQIPTRDADVIIRTCREEGYSEKALCFVADKREAKLLQYLGDDRFPSIYINEVRKHAFKKNDER